MYSEPSSRGHFKEYTFTKGATLLGPIQKSDFYNLGGGFKYFLFSPLFGEDSQFD